MYSRECGLKGLSWLKKCNAWDATTYTACVFTMETRSKMLFEARLFVRLGLLSFVGFGFYYAHLFFGIMANAFLFKALAVTFLLAAIPLPIIAVNNKKLFPELRGSGKAMLTFGSILLLMHHFLMTFIFVLFLQGDKVF